MTRAGHREVAIRLTTVTRAFGSPTPIRALDRVSLAIDRGSLVSVVGRSGSGKTTLLSLMGLLDQPDEGRIELFGEDVTEIPESRRSALRLHHLAFVFQNFHLIGHRSVTENLAVALRYSPYSRHERGRLIDQVTDRLGLGARREVDVRNLSGGEQQRVAIGRALVKDARVVLCDEPTGNLDTATARSVLGLLGEIHREGRTVVIVTHDPVVAGFTQRRIELQDGRVV